MPTSAAGQEAEPTASVPDGPVEIGQVILVSGDNWPTDAIATGVICGNEALDGSVDCALEASSVNGIWSDGSLRLELEVVEPPRSCPCVVRVSTGANSVVIDIPVDIAGVEVEPPTRRFGRPGVEYLEIVSVEVAGRGSIVSWFGWPPSRSLELLIRNTGELEVQDILVLATWADSSGEEHVVDAVELAAIAPNSERDVVVPITFDAFASGSFLIEGDVLVGEESLGFSTKTSMQPWGAILVGVLALQAMLVVVVGRLPRVWDRLRGWKERRALKLGKLEAELLTEIDRRLSARFDDDGDAADVSDVFAAISEEVQGAVHAVGSTRGLPPAEMDALAKTVTDEIIREFEASSNSLVDY